MGAAAAALQQHRFAPWPDWRGKACAIVASGPSAKQAGIGALKGRLPVLAIKKNVELAPWADVVYGCDGPWWRHERGLPKFCGLKLCYDVQACDEFGLRRVHIPDKLSNRLLFGQTGTIGAAGNSGFQALNLAAQFGATRILLIGFDAHGRGGEHWYGRNNWNFANNPTEDNYRRWRHAFELALHDLTERGIDVINASMSSDLKCFPKATVAAALDLWAL
jgi:hypothetical protein